MSSNGSERISALGAAYLAGLEAGVFTLEGMSSNWAVDKRFTPQMDSSTRDKMYAGWQRAAERSKGWLEN